MLDLCNHKVDINESNFFDFCKLISLFEYEFEQQNELFKDIQLKVDNLDDKIKSNESLMDLISKNLIHAEEIIISSKSTLANYYNEYLLKSSDIISKKVKKYISNT